MSKKLTILVDMDGIVADFQAAYVQHYNHALPNNEPVLTKNDIIHWDLANVTKNTIAKDWVQETIKSYTFWRTLPLMSSNCVEILKNWSERYSVFFCTAPYYKAYGESCKGKLEWVEEYFPFIGADRTHITKYKHMVKGDVLIDDKPTNLKYWPTPYKATVLYPFHKKMDIKTADGVLFADSWLDPENAWNMIDKAIQGLVICRDTGTVANNLNEALMYSA